MFYRWRSQVLRFGPEILRPRERRRPRMANQTSPFVEQGIVAPAPEWHLDVHRPGEMVQMDRFFIGRLSGAKGAVWQYAAIDVASAYCWAELHLTPRNPSPRFTSELARRVAQDLAARGWSLEQVMTDNASEFRSEEFERAVERLGGHLFIRARRPQTNGCVERARETILEECWRRHISLTGQAPASAG